MIYLTRTIEFEYTSLDRTFILETMPQQAIAQIKTQYVLIAWPSTNGEKHAQIFCVTVDHHPLVVQLWGGGL